MTTKTATVLASTDGSKYFLGYKGGSTDTAVRAAVGATLAHTDGPANWSIIDAEVESDPVPAIGDTLTPDTGVLKKSA